MTKQSKNTLITAIAILAGIILLLYGGPSILSFLNPTSPEEIAERKTELTRMRRRIDSLAAIDSARAYRDSVNAELHRYQDSLRSNK